jgi:prepilin peptidase CpaA
VTAHLTAQALLAGGIGIAASIDDLRRRQISNWIPLAALGSGVVLQSVQHGWSGLGSALFGTLAGASVFLVFYLLGGMGGGDVKLMAGFGALLGWKLLLQAALWTAGVGGVMALVVIAARAAGHLWKRARPSAHQAPALATSKADSIPYAPAIAAGVWLSLVGAR